VGIGVVAEIVTVAAAVAGIGVVAEIVTVAAAVVIAARVTNG
jgi:hypothetical protein